MSISSALEDVIATALLTQPCLITHWVTVGATPLSERSLPTTQCTDFIRLVC